MQDCKALYGDGDHCLALFSPNIQLSTLQPQNRERVFFGTAPTLQTLCLAYGRNFAESWVMVQLNDLNEWASTKEHLSATQINSVAAIIVAAYPYLRLTELALFFALFKAGEYGRFYGSVDSITITTALRQKFLPFRTSARRYFLEKSAQLQSEQEARLHAQQMKQKYLSSLPTPE